MEKNIAMEYVQDVTKPMAIVPMIAMGIMRSGRWISSARWVAQSRHAKAQFVFMRPTMNAMGLEDQPVLFSLCFWLAFAF